MPQPDGVRLMPDSEGRRSGPIAIVAHTHPSVSKGGAEIAAFNLYEGLRAVGTDAIFIAVCPITARHKLSLGSEREFVIFADQQRYDHFYQLSSPCTSSWRFVTIMVRWSPDPRGDYAKWRRLSDAPHVFPSIVASSSWPAGD